MNAPKRTGYSTAGGVPRPTTATLMKAGATGAAAAAAAALGGVVGAQSADAAPVHHHAASSSFSAHQRHTKHPVRHSIHIAKHSAKNRTVTHKAAKKSAAPRPASSHGARSLAQIERANPIGSIRGQCSRFVASALGFEAPGSGLGPTDGKLMAGYLISSRGWSPVSKFNLQPFDVVSINSGGQRHGHTGFVVAVNGGTVTLLNSNYGKKLAVTFNTFRLSQISSAARQ